MRRFLAALSLAILAAATLNADSTVILKDGRKVVGRLMESGDTVGVVTEDGLKLFERSEIERIEYDAFGRASKEQIDAYFKVRRDAKQVKEPADGVALWKEYLAGCEKGNPLIPEAQKELARWEEALASGKVVWGGKLVTAEERAALEAQAAEAFDKGVAEFRAGKTTEALPLLREAVRTWSDNPAMCFYYALASQKARAPTEAIKYYRGVVEAFPDHVTTLNNLGTLECARRDFVTGVPRVLRAATLAPTDTVVGDNVYRTILRLEDVKIKVLEDELYQLRQLDARFEAAQRGRGLGRWGTSWLSLDEVNRLDARNREIETRLNALTNEVNALQTEIQSLKARIVELQRQYQMAPTERHVNEGIDTDGDGRADRWPHRGETTKEQLQAQLNEQRRQVSAKENEINRKIIEGRRLQADRKTPPKQLDYFMLEDPGREFSAASGLER